MEGESRNKDNPYAQDELVVTGSYATPLNWEFSAGATLLSNDHYYSEKRSSDYSDCGAGGCTHATYGKMFDARVRYAYAGFTLAVHKWLTTEMPGFQWGFGLYQHTDFLIGYSERDRRSKEYNSYSVWYTNPNFEDYTTSSETDWKDDAFSVYRMRSYFAYAGLETGPRFVLHGFYLEPSVSLAFGKQSRTYNLNYDREHGDSPYPENDWRSGVHAMPAFSCKLGYIFPSKKP